MRTSSHRGPALAFARWSHPTAVSLLRRPAIEDIPADAGSIGHVADAASVRSGKFFSAARLKETPATREAAEIIEVPELAPELEAPVAEQASADKKTNKKSTTKVMTESDSDEGVTPETPAASAGLDTQSASKKSAKASKAAKPETEVKPPKAAKKESADSAKNKVAGEKKATNAEPKTAPKKPKGEKK